MENELKLLEVYLGVHPNSDSKEQIEKRIAVLEFELMETLDKEWSAWLKGVPWDGYGSTIAESNRIFDFKRKKWVKKMVKKHNAKMSMLETRYGRD